MTSLLRELFDAVRRAPDHRATADRRLRAVTDKELEAAIAASGLPSCGEVNCTCGDEGLTYRPRHET